MTISFFLRVYSNTKSLIKFSTAALHKINNLLKSEQAYKRMYILDELYYLLLFGSWSKTVTKRYSYSPRQYKPNRFIEYLKYTFEKDCTGT